MAGKISEQQKTGRGALPDRIDAPRILFYHGQGLMMAQKQEVRALKQCMDSDNLHRRLKKIIGQVNAIDKMIDEDIPCEDILSQINAAKSALNKCGGIILEGHINHCMRQAFETGDEKEIQNFTKAIERFSNMQ